VEDYAGRQIVGMDLVGADYSVTAADLVSSAAPGGAKFGIWLRGGQSFRHFQYSCHCDSPTSRPCECSVGPVVTMTVYAHVLPGNQRDAADTFARLMREASGREKCHGDATALVQGELQGVYLQKPGVRGGT
jgi:hypothetical protein